MKNLPEAQGLVRVISVSDLPPAGVALTIVATPAQRAALAERFELLALSRLEAEIQVKPDRDGAILVEGRFVADVTQRCVATLEPVESKVAEDLQSRYAPGAPEDAEAVIVAPFDEDPPEPLTGDEIDVGALIAEHLALALDTYPRHPDAPADPVVWTSDEEQEESPFTALGQLRGKL